MFLLSGQKGKDAMITDSRFGGGRSVDVDSVKVDSLEVYRHPLLKTISPYLHSLESLKDPVARLWQPQLVCATCVLMAYDAADGLCVRLQTARDLWDPIDQQLGGRTYNGLCKAMLRQAEWVLPVLQADLREHVRRVLPRLPRCCGWSLFAVDGSKEELPRTASNEAFFELADNGHHPQARISGIVEVHTSLLWDYRVDKGNACEKRHLMAMAADLPKKSLLLGDANYVGYPLWRHLHQLGQRFLVRVGGCVSLLRDLWPQADLQREGELVFVWPPGRQESDEPLVLRLLSVGHGEHRVYLLTNVLDVVQLSRRRAGKIYRLRWGVELFFRGFKRTLGLFKLKSRTAQRAVLELEWALIAANILTLVGVWALLAAGKNPRLLSLAGVIQSVRQALHHPLSTSASDVGDRLERRLAGSLRDTYRRRGPKRSRHRPYTRNTPKPHRKPPRIRPATAKEQAYAQLRWRKDEA